MQAQPSWLLMIAILFLACHNAFAVSPQVVTLQDHIGADWTHELVHYEIQVPQGEMKGAPLASVKDASGKTITCQISNTTLHPDTSVKSFWVWFFADVPAHGKATYTIIPGEQGKATTAVTVKQEKDSIEISTNAQGRIGIRLPFGKQEYDWPIPATNLPGPVLGLLQPDGTETAKGRFVTPFLVKSWSSELTASGPLFAEVKVHYTFDVGYWTFTARVQGGTPVVIIEEELDTGRFDGTSRELDRFYELVLNDRAFKPSQLFYAATLNDRPEQTTLLNLQTVPEWKNTVDVRDNWVCSRICGYNLTFDKDSEDYYLSANPAHNPRIGMAFRAVQPGKTSIAMMGLDNMRWRNPQTIRVARTKTGELIAKLPLQACKQVWGIDSFGGGSPNYTGKTLYVPQNTLRRHYGIMLTKAEDETKSMMASVFPQIERLAHHPLDIVKDWQLDIPDPMAKQEWAKETSKKGKEALDYLRNWVKLKRLAGNCARYSMAYHFVIAQTIFPLIEPVLNSPKDLTAADRKEMRRLCAFFAYDVNARNTFPWGSGFHLNNPNMTIMALEARIKTSVLVQDHPMFKRWGDWSRNLLADYLGRFTFDSGAPYECPHYTLGVTLDKAAKTNELLIKYGLGDAFDSELFRRCMRFIPQAWLTPPDPRFFNHRVVVPYGNTSYQSFPSGAAERLVSYLKPKHPQLAAELQWTANQTLKDDKKISVVEKEKAPTLESGWYKDYGVVFRHGFGTPYETYFLMFAGKGDGHGEWESDQMTYTYYAKGMPINLHFGNGYFPMLCRPWLRNRVSIDHMWETSERNETDVITACFTPATEYMRAYRDIDQIRPMKGETPLMDKGKWNAEERENWPALPTNNIDIPLTKWYRQVMFLKDADPKGPNYFVVRDDFGGVATRPTDVNYWFLANKMEKDGKVFHFDGQLDVDMDVFVNTPETFEPITGEFSHKQQPYIRQTGEDLSKYPNKKRQEKQLMLRIKQPAGKPYMVVLYPRLKEGDPKATFTRLSDTAVKVETALSTDYVFLRPYTFKDEVNDGSGIVFEGMAASVRLYKTGKIVFTNTEGDVKLTLKGQTFTGSGAFAVTIENGKQNFKAYSKDATFAVQKP